MTPLSANPPPNILSRTGLISIGILFRKWMPCHALWYCFPGHISYENGVTTAAADTWGGNSGLRIDF